MPIIGGTWAPRGTRGAAVHQRREKRRAPCGRARALLTRMSNDAESAASPEDVDHEEVREADQDGEPDEALGHVAAVALSVVEALKEEKDDEEDEDPRCSGDADNWSYIGAPSSKLPGERGNPPLFGVFAGPAGLGRSVHRTFTSPCVVPLSSCANLHQNSRC